MWLDEDLDVRLADRRAEQAGATDAEELVSACPYCEQTLEDGTKKVGVDLPVRDLAALLVEALDAAREVAA